MDNINQLLPTIFHVVPTILKDHTAYFQWFFFVFKPKIIRLDKEIKRLRLKIKNLDDQLSKEKYEKNQLSFIDDEIIKDVMLNIKNVLKSRTYSAKFISFCLIACLFGRKCYNFIRRRLPLVSVSYLEPLSRPSLNNITKNLFNINGLSNYIELYKSSFHVTLSDDAATFQKNSGDDLLRQIPFLKEI